MELWLVGGFLLALFFLVSFIMWIPADWITGTYDNTADEIIEFKDEMISILLTAFGAWIGAGAAYFFGRENLREAVSGIKTAKASVDSILRGTKVSDLPLRASKYRFRLTEKLEKAADYIRDNRDVWFFVLIDEEDKYVASIHEEEIWRMRTGLSDYFTGAHVDWDAVKGGPIWKALKAIATPAGKKLKVDEMKEENSNQPAGKPKKTDLDLIKEKLEIAEVFKLEDTIQSADARLSKKSKKVGIVVDNDRKPTGYFTTGDIRRALTGRTRNAER